ncbi:hypothetical protein [Brevibacterium aurantiacum]|uniref:Uncharacterized protein n=1 Tax=Brevibacterium aurantiacum TaxID=273384 RepID=A0A3T0DRW0_BREAU|nr:hypothetical protein [Brevibacterium aurantiacum]AZT97724.1 hypothetical protein CXR27_12510 [Brevibacterium aurantiacum]
MTISDYLPQGYQPVYGTGIHPDHFKPDPTSNGQGWVVCGLTTSGKQGEFRITLATDVESTDDSDVISSDRGLATCEVVVNGERRTVQHPYSKRIGGLASVADWYDAIAIEDAKGRKTELTTPWSGQDVDSTLTRVEHNIVAYGDDEVAVESFSSAAEVSKWLEDVLTKTQVRAEVWQVRNAFESDKIADQTMLRRFRNDEVDGWAPIPFSTSYISKDWLEHAFGDELFSPFVHLRMLGAQRESLDADYALSWNELMESGELTREDIRLESGGDDWLVIRVLDSDLALPLPWPGANIVVHHDEDGARVGIDVLITEAQDKKNRKQKVWESEWGRFLDETITLTDAEIAEGINRAEGHLQALIEEEE